MSSGLDNCPLRCHPLTMLSGFGNLSGMSNEQPTPTIDLTVGITWTDAEGEHVRLCRPDHADEWQIEAADGSAAYTYGTDPVQLAEAAFAPADVLSWARAAA